MAEVAAFSLAANIVQFIDSGSKFALNLRRFHSSGCDGVKELADLRKLTEDLEHVSKHFQGPREASDNGDLNQSDFVDLAKRCEAVAATLLHSLTSITSSGTHGKRDALRAALKLQWKENEIKSLQGQLDEFRQELSLNLLNSLRDQARKSWEQQVKVLNQLRDIQEGTNKLERKLDEVSGDADGMGASVLEFLTSKLDVSNRTEAILHLRQALVTKIYGEDNGNTHPAPNISGYHRDALETAFIRRFRYNAMFDRQDRIAKAHKDTFRWVFGEVGEQDPKWASLTEWLESDAPLYWITGKAGSGKSTLMKYICGEELEETRGDGRTRCEKFLRKWSTDSRLAIATFFFWNSGSQIQMSRRGLLLTLMFRILRSFPELIPTVSPSRWEALCLFNDDPQEWTDQELGQMLISATKHLHQGMKVCIFVDGLDEFEGDVDDLVRLFRQVVLHRNVKLCVASRPWVQFEDAFKHSPSLMLQDLTYSDIKLFINSSFSNNSYFAQLRMREPEYANKLVENITSKASGVFLWVTLVVSSLLAGMSYGDRVSDLQRRLDYLPPDLEKLYDHIMHCIDPFYLEHAAQLFKLVQESDSPPTLLHLSFADDDSATSAINRPIRALSEDQVSLRVDTMRLRLNSRCKGFLEPGPTRHDVRWGGNTSVQYLHRTVKDYTKSDVVQAKLQDAIQPSFDPHLSICAGSLSLLKSIGYFPVAEKSSAFSDCVSACLRGAARMPLSHRTTIINLLEELKRTASKIMSPSIYFRYKFCPPDDYLRRDMRTRNQWKDDESYFRYMFSSGFIRLAIIYGIFPYIEVKAERECLLPLQGLEEPWPLLLDAIFFAGAQPRMDVIACLVKKGADPRRAGRYQFKNGISSKFVPKKEECTSPHFEEDQLLMAKDAVNQVLREMEKSGQVRSEVDPVHWEDSTANKYSGLPSGRKSWLRMLFRKTNKSR